MIIPNITKFHMRESTFRWAVPYTATQTDGSTHGQELWAGLTGGTYGQVTAFKVTNEMLEAAKDAKRAETNRWRDAQENMEYLMEF